MAQDVVIVIRVEDEGTRALAGAGEALDKMGEKTRRTAKGLDRQTKSSKALGAASSFVKAGLVGIALEATKLIGLLTGLAAGTKAALDAFKEQDAVNRDLADSLSRAGLQGEELNATYKELQATAGEFASKTLFGDEDILSAQAKYIQLTGEAKVSTEDLSTILGIASKQGIDASAASEKYALALKGEVDALKDITPLTKKQAEDLGKLKSQSEKTAKAQEILQAQFMGTAEGVSPTFNAMKNLSDAKGDLLQRIGEVIEASGVIPIILTPVTEVFRAVEAAIGDNAVAIQHLILNGVDKAIVGFVSFIEILEANKDILGAGVAVIKIFGQAMAAIGNIVMGVQRIIITMVTGALSGMMSAIEGLVGALAAAARAVGQDGLARNLQIAADTAAGMGETFDGIAENQIQGLQDNIDGVAGSLSGMGDEVFASEEYADVLGEGFDKVKERAAQAREEIQAQHKAVKELGNAPTRGGGGGGGGPRDDLKVKDEEAAKLARQKKLEEEIATVQLAALREKDATLKAVLEYQAAEMEIQAQGLEGAKEELALEQANLELQDKLAALEQQKLDVAKARREEQQQAHEEAMAALDAEIKAQNDLWATVGRGLSQLNSGSTVADGLSDVFGTTTVQVADLAAELERVNQGLIDGAKVSTDAFSVIGGSIATFADQMGVSAAKQAGILALFETAAAAAAFAIGNIPGGIQHSIAAATYAAVAATSATAKGQASGQAAASRASSSSSSSRGSRDEARRGADLLAEALGRREGGGGDIYIQFDQRGGINGRPTPEMENQIASAARSGFSRQGFDVGRLKRRRG